MMAAGRRTTAFDELPKVLAAKQRSTQQLRLASVAALHELRLEAMYKAEQAVALQRKRSASFAAPDVSRGLRSLMMRVDALQSAAQHVDVQRTEFDGANKSRGWPDLVEVTASLPAAMGEISENMDAVLEALEAALQRADDDTDDAAELAALVQHETDALKLRKRTALNELDRVRKSSAPRAEESVMAQQQQAAEVEKLRATRTKLRGRVAALEQTLGHVSNGQENVKQ